MSQHGQMMVFGGPARYHVPGSRPIHMLSKPLDTEKVDLAQ